jgi:drug/metabolite transporter (DMT)-like permease
MLFWLALSAAFGCALCNGIAAVLQKAGADQEKPATTMQLGLFLRLLGDWPYLIGLALDGLAFILTLVAVHTLALFIVQPIIALNVAITVLIEHYLLHRRIGKIAGSAMLCIFAGLLLLVLVSAPETAHRVAQAVRWTIVFMPLVLAGIGSMVARSRHHAASIGLGALGGIAFGGTSIVGRMLTFPQPYWHLILNPLVWSLLAYGLVGILLFTIALQRSNASIVTASITAFEATVPIVVGIFCLGDSPKNNDWTLVVAGIVLTLTGALIFALPKVAPARLNRS